jgi:ABC-2 type transport system permease protein
VKLRALVLRSLGRARGLLVTVGLVLAAFELVLVIAAAYLHETKAFSQIAAFLPIFLQQIVGAAAFTSFSGLVGFGYFHPIVVITFVGIAIVLASEPAGEVEDGLVNLVLARPVPRRIVVFRTILAFTIGTSFIALGMALANWLAILAWRPPDARAPSSATLLQLVGNLLAVGWTFGALSLLAATLARRRAVAAGTAGVIALGLYLLNFLAGISPSLQPYGSWSPFHYYEAMSIVMGASANWLRDVAILLTATTVLSAASFVAYSRRDL